jgi:hypothetical protein
MSREYAIHLYFQGEWFVSEKRWDNPEEAQAYGEQNYKKHVTWEVETIRSSTPFQKV